LKIAFDCQTKLKYEIFSVEVPAMNPCPAPAESDFVRYFKKTPPAIHQMIMKLEELGFITKIPEKARSIQLLISKDELPDLE
jgi:hypothetical protein